MDILQSVIQFVKDNWVEILAAIGAIDILLGIIVKLTPVSWDDSVYTVIHGWITKLTTKK
jgi:hypothetical protein